MGSNLYHCLVFDLTNICGWGHWGEGQLEWYMTWSLFFVFLSWQTFVWGESRWKGLTQEVTRVRQELDAVSKTGVSRVKLSSIQPLIIVIIMIIISILYHLVVFFSTFIYLEYPNKTDSSLWKKIKQLCSGLSFIALVNYELFDVLDALARVTISLKHKSTLENVENQYRHVGWLRLDEHQEWAKFLSLFCNSFVFLGKLYLD